MDEHYEFDWSLMMSNPHGVLPGIKVLMLYALTLEGLDQSHPIKMIAIGQRIADQNLHLYG